MTDKERWTKNADDLAAIAAKLISMSRDETSTVEITALEWTINDVMRLARSYTDRLEAHDVTMGQFKDSLALEEGK